MKKRLRTESIINELEGSSLYFTTQEAMQPVATQQAGPTHPAEQPVARPANQSTNRPTVVSTSGAERGIVPRPKAFYITRRLDQCLDAAVRYFQEQHGIVKIDRSTLINAMLDNVEQWSEEALDVLVDRVISQLTSRLTEK